MQGRQRWYRVHGPHSYSSCVYHTQLLHSVVQGLWQVWDPVTSYEQTTLMTDMQSSSAEGPDELAVGQNLTAYKGPARWPERLPPVLTADCGRAAGLTRLTGGGGVLEIQRGPGAVVRA